MTFHVRPQYGLISCSLLWAWICVVPCAQADRVLTLNGSSADVGFGVSVLTPGDLNADGGADVTVGATTFDGEGEVNPGRVHIFFGGASVDGIADLVLTGQANGDRFGYVHAAAGDVNDDGHADLLVGAYLNDGNGTNSGRAYVYYGGPSLDATPDLVLTGLQAGEQFGISVAGIGDVNADGADDLLVGARFNSTGGAETGRAYVYYGGTNVDGTPDLVLNGQTPMERLGFASAGGKDVNGDGHADFVVGAYHNPVFGFETGRAYVYFGGSAVDATPDLVLNGEGTRAHFGDALDMGDLNGDGVGDILVGASQYAGAAGRAYVYFGGAAVDATADLVLQTGVVGDWFGRFVSVGTDVSADGYADLLVGAPALNNGGPGRAYVYEGGPAVDAVFDAAFDGVAALDAFGWNGSGTGQDVDMDGSDDFVLGAFRNDAAGAYSGRVYLFLSNNSPPDCSGVTSTVTRLWPPNHAYVDVAVVGATDPDGDLTTLRIVGITTDELTQGRRGDRCPDAINNVQSARLRAERVESGNGRVYTLRYRAEDPGGNSCTGFVTVCVPPTQDTGCIDDGPLFDATICPPRAASGLMARATRAHVEFDFELESETHARAEIYDARGRRIRQLAEGEFGPGRHSILWDGRMDSGGTAPTGVYVLRLVHGAGFESTKFVLLR